MSAGAPAAAASPPAPQRDPDGRVDVVHVTQALKAGLRRYIVDLMTGLDERGVRQALVYSPHVTDLATAGAVAALRARGIPVFELPMVRSVHPVRDAMSAARLWALLRRMTPAVLHLHSSKAGGVGRLAATALGGATAVVYTPNASAANLGRRYVTIERALGSLRTDRLVAVSRSEFDELAALRVVAPSKLVHVDTGVPTAEIRTAAREPRPAGLPTCGPLVVAAGRLSAQKNPRFLVRVSARLAQTHPGLRFVWAGDGELQGDVERDIAAAGVQDRWTLLGPLANPYPLLAAADVVVLPSLYEGLPLVLLEAMALGRPIVATDVTGSRDAVSPGVTGELVAPGDEAGFAAAIARVTSDPALAARYGAEAGRRAEAHFTRERMAAEMAEVYRGVGLRPRDE